ncbi:hypothetical protein P7C71_g4221, partial [Lecanoromycetidae sp. Uapishka_2]
MSSNFPANQQGSVDLVMVRVPATPSNEGPSGEREYSDDEYLKASRPILPSNDRPKIELWEVSINDLAEDCRDCNICLQPYPPKSTGEKALKMMCGHIFGSDCILQWAQTQGTDSMTCPMCRHDPLADVWTIDKALAALQIDEYVGLVSDMPRHQTHLSTLFKNPNPLQARRLDAICTYLRGEVLHGPSQRYYNLTVWQTMVLYRIVYARKAHTHVDIEMLALSQHMGRAAARYRLCMDGKGEGRVPWTRLGPLVYTLLNPGKVDDVLYELVKLLKAEDEEWNERMEAGGEEVVTRVQVWELQRPVSNS